MKLSFRKILKEIFTDEEQDPRIPGVLADLKNLQFKSGINAEFVMNFLARRHKFNRKNFQEEGLLNGFVIAVGLLDPREADGDPEAIQSALVLWEENK